MSVFQPVQNHNKKIPELEKIIYLSDGCAEQYKNKSNFKNLCSHEKDSNVRAERHFFPTSHGKGPCDGVRDQRVRSGKIITWRNRYGTSINSPYEISYNTTQREKFMPTITTTAAAAAVVSFHEQRCVVIVIRSSSCLPIERECSVIKQPRERRRESESERERPHR